MGVHARLLYDGKSAKEIRDRLGNPLNVEQIDGSYFKIRHPAFSSVEPGTQIPRCTTAEALELIKNFKECSCKYCTPSFFGETSGN